MPKHSKRYDEAAAKVERLRHYTPDEALSLTKETASAKFDETVELHIRTGLDPRHADQQLRGTAQLPHGLGKTIRVAVFTEGEGQRVAREAEAGEIVEQIRTEAPGRLEPGELLVGEAQPRQELEHGIEPRGHQELAPGWQGADEELEHRGLGLAMVQVSLDHVELIEIGQQRRDCVIHRAAPWVMRPREYRNRMR